MPSYVIVTSGGCFRAFTVTILGISRGGGGTGFNVVLSRLDPSAEYEYFAALE